MAPPQIKRLTFLPVVKVAPVWWVLVVLALATADFFTGPYFQLPAVYVIPVALAAWFSGRNVGVVLAVALPLSRVLLMATAWDEPWDTEVYVATAVTRIGAYVVMALMTSRLAEFERSLARELTALRSLLPVCTYCHKIRDADDTWEPLDDYVARRQGEFATGMCPDCARIHLPEHAPVAREQRS